MDRATMNGVRFWTEVGGQSCKTAILAHKLQPTFGLWSGNNDSTKELQSCRIGPLNSAIAPGSDGLGLHAVADGVVWPAWDDAAVWLGADAILG